MLASTRGSTGGAAELLDRLRPLATGVGHALRHVLTAIARRAGLPVVLVAAIALVLSLRFARRAVRIAVEIAVAAVLLAVATAHGWLRW